MGINNLKNSITYAVSSLVPKQNDMWTFGAWLGQRYSDNPKAFLDYMVKEHPEYKYNWISKKPEEVDHHVGKVRVLPYGSTEAWKAIIRSKYVVMSHGHDDFSTLNWTGGAVRIQLYHGVGWKHVGLDTFKPSGSKIKDVIRKINLRWAHYLSAKGDFFISPSDAWSRCLKTAFGAKDSQIISTGLPRNEMFFDEQRMNEYRSSILKKLGIKNKTVKIIAYLPTFRDSGKDVFSFFDHQEELRKVLNRAIVIEKVHFAGNKSERINSTIVYDGKDIDTQELMAAADLFISDYSGCIFDYLVLDRPIIQFEYDYDEYAKKDRGLYFPIDKVDCGHVAIDDESLFEYLRTFCNEGLECSDKQLKLKKWIITNEDGHSSEKIYRAIMNK